MRCAEKVAAAYRLAIFDALAAVRNENECNCAGIPDEDGGSTHTGDCSLTRNLAAIRHLITPAATPKDGP